ncbi:hypothetical protein J8273_3292 [Carpediemonas membranifera]|uniref:Uncharacterized protein n=1 Tax=Carpediemonas membranifera TaxID=201153 RepID=A0A8J6ASS2_9EUKA|nr:hypothetical protein J8273_3292 [Carpediemonas membranifera]|eukprot:KAG9393163.1 hypothetical protein J8273_3292 [Carpediemonas membranifera]
MVDSGIGMALDTLLHCFAPEPSDLTETMVFGGLIGGAGSALQSVLTGGTNMEHAEAAIEGALDGLVMDSLLFVSGGERAMDLVWAGAAASAVTSLLSRDRSLQKAGRAAVGGGIYWGLFAVGTQFFSKHK